MAQSKFHITIHLIKNIPKLLDLTCANIKNIHNQHVNPHTYLKICKFICNLQFFFALIFAGSALLKINHIFVTSIITINELNIFHEQFNLTIINNVGIVYYIVEIYKYSYYIA